MSDRDDELPCWDVEHGDALAWLKDRPSRSVEAVVTDPPYGLVEFTPAELKKLSDGSGGIWRIPRSHNGNVRRPAPRFTVLVGSQRDAIATFFEQVGAELLRVVVPGGNIFVASNPLLSHLVCSGLECAGLEKRGEVVRLVRTLRGGERPKNAHEDFPNVSIMPRSAWEPWLLFRTPLEGRVQDNLRMWSTGGLRREESRPFADVIAAGKPTKREREIAPHPALKPQAFLRPIVWASLPLGEGVVLDPFMGSGSTLAAAAAVGYRSIGIDQSLEFTELAKRAIPLLSSLDFEGWPGRHPDETSAPPSEAAL